VIKSGFFDKINYSMIVNALRPHHVWKYGRHPISDCWD